ncbi:hypothetical protein [Caviibacter abscessus]|uniref:hypothetical protein n=1 Tax=Caviibacter abscessus TaxID=1766719 RepID=UPI000834F6F5|nr:hypothetical protein [Caviibacter abscessus]
MKKYIAIFCTLVCTISVAKTNDLLASTTSVTKKNNIEVKALVGFGGYLFENSQYAPIISGSVSVYKTLDLSELTKIKTFGINVGGGLDLNVQLKTEDMSFTPTVRLIPFISTELFGKPHKNYRVYGGLDLGVGIESENDSPFVSYMSKVYIGTTYKEKFTAELGVGYPGTISLGIGARFGF